MNEWAVFGVLVAVAGFLAVVVPPIVNLTKSITRLTVVVDNLSKDMELQRKSNSKLWQHNDEQDDKLQDHETRLRILEKVE